MLADKAYDADRLRTSLREKGAFANIPPKANRRSKPYFSTWLYRERNLIERFFSKLKHFRRVATRYDKLAENFLAMVQLASMRLWLRVYESTAQYAGVHSGRPASLLGAGRDGTGNAQVGRLSHGPLWFPCGCQGGAGRRASDPASLSSVSKGDIQKLSRHVLPTDRERLTAMGAKRS